VGACSTLFIQEEGEGLSYNMEKRKFEENLPRGSYVHGIKGYLKKVR
jgi:hypothetical protein